jgi:hypothetical protein
VYRSFFFAKGYIQFNISTGGNIMKLGYLFQNPGKLASVSRARRQGAFRIVESRLTDTIRSEVKGFRFASKPDFSPIERDLQKWGKETLRLTVTAGDRRTQIIARPDKLSGLVQLEIGRDILIFAPAGEEDQPEAEYSVDPLTALIVAGVVITGMVVVGAISIVAIVHGASASVTVTTDSGSASVDINQQGDGEEDDSDE